MVSTKRTWESYSCCTSINIMKLVFILAVLSLAVVAASPDDSINNNVQMRIERDAGKKMQRKRIQKAKKIKKAKNRSNKKRKAKSGKLKKEGKSKCPRGKQGRKCRQERQNSLGPSCPPTPTCPPPTPAPAPSPPSSDCSAVNTAYTQYKRATNWMKQCTRVNNWNTIITNKGGKKDDFMAGAMALDSATMNGTSCAGGAANTTVNDAMNTLKNCSTSIGAGCVPNSNISVCETTNQCQTDLNATKMAFEACLTNANPCTCFASVPAAPSSCNPGTVQTDTKATLKSCKSAFSACSKGLKEAGAYVDQCKCDCMTMTTVAPGRARRELLNIKWQ